MVECSISFQNLAEVHRAEAGHCYTFFVPKVKFSYVVDLGQNTKTSLCVKEAALPFLSSSPLFEDDILISPNGIQDTSQPDCCLPLQSHILTPIYPRITTDVSQLIMVAPKWAIFTAPLPFFTNSTNIWGISSVCHSQCLGLTINDEQGNMIQGLVQCRV